MSKKLRIVLAQLNLVVGDIEGNLAKLMQAATHARNNLAADVIVFPELSITGYPPEDLLFRQAFLAAADAAVMTFKEKVQNIYCVIGHPYANEHGIYNACSLIHNGQILGRYAKQHLPNYGVFDEYRYFIPGDSACVLPIHGIPVGIVICEDLWHSGPIEQAVAEGARLILSPNASPFEIDKDLQRSRVLAMRAKTDHVPIVYVNCVGGQDELVFDGGSMVMDAAGNVCQHGGFFKEMLLPIDFEVTAKQINVPKTPVTLPSEEAITYEALVLGVRDYINKNHFPGVLVGASGGIDSALTLAIAVDALGPERVKAIMMPSRYSAAISTTDALTLINNLGIAHETISIEPVFKSFLEILAPSFVGKKPDVTEENIQSRCRGVILMALSNKTGYLVLTTGNRSELAVGYSTIYGDMAGGFNALKDVAKTLVYRLAHYRNQINPVIPESTISRPPTAELAPNQKDEDSLPPYSVLDQILELYINQEKSVDDIVNLGFDHALVLKIINLINKNEYKRRQAPIGVRINHKAFGRDRRYPITHGFKNK